MADLVTRPHAIELYTDLKKRYSTFPKDRYEFVDAICESNKRIHCTVEDYTDQHRKIERKKDAKTEDVEKSIREAKRKECNMHSFFYMAIL